MSRLTFAEAMARDGFSVGGIIEDGDFHRFAVDGDRSGKRSGWYVCFGSWGSYGDWRSGFKRGWRATGGPTDFTQAVREHRQKRSETHTEGKRRAAYIWSIATPVIGHEYLTRKRVRAHALRVHRNLLVIPARRDGELVTLEFVSADGTKRFLKGGRKHGAYHVIGKPDSLIFIAEGYATAASIFESTGICCVVAFDAGNLLEVGRAVRAKYPNTEIIFAADNDKTAGNPGVSKALHAGSDIGASVVFPSQWADFNDLYCQGRAQAVRDELARSSWKLAAAIREKSQC